MYYSQIAEVVSMKNFAQIVLLTVILLTVNTSLAAEGDIDRLKTQQKQLQSILNDLEKASQQRTQHNQKIQQLKHQLECNWALIRSYEICSQLHGKNPAEHLKCSATAKRTAAACLGSGQPK